MQLLAESSEEGGFHKGLGIIPGKVKEIKKEKNIRIPHIGFNEVSFPENSFLSDCSQKTRDFYFVHSYCIYNDEINDGKLGLTEYGEKFVSLYEKILFMQLNFIRKKVKLMVCFFLKSFLDL